ncbi:acetyltransferase [Halomonas litopenaei]|uniref:Acetyltransferase n=1 Tax=Halomonas litopenaei TaxID=2109328 RepID=A0ABX5IUA4_9GAMM|nr:acetyltransferase [Halomonas sp. SYSU XM8]PTL94129.1 acetyltransferase [Halomonas litopenaei]
MSQIKRSLQQSNLTKHSRGTPNAWHFWFWLGSVFMVVRLSLVVVRCSPLNTALYTR